MFKHIPFLCSAAALLLAGCIMPPKAPPAPALPKPPSKLTTQPFWWGTSTSPFQNEDVAEPKGSPMAFRTDWDVFADEGLTPPRTDGPMSWTHFDRDIEAVKALGLNHFRFGVEWARVEPKPGVYNEAAIRRYAEMARRVRAAGIEPIITLWHFTFPDWLYDRKNKTRANFLHPEVEAHWETYVTKMVAALRPHVRIFVPQNEPNGALQLGYVGAHWPPGLLLRPFSYKRAMDVSARMFIRASEIIRKGRPDALVMGIYSMPHWSRNPWLDPTAAVYNTMQRQNYDHLDKVVHSMDLIGVNYYYSQNATIQDFLKHGMGEIGSNYTQMGWRIAPEGFHRSLMDVWHRYHKPIVISENGIGTQSERKRIAYLRSHIAQMRRAMADGAAIQGYFPWTLVDNYEWTEGYAANFGLSYMDPKTKKRIFEPSAIWLRNFIKAHPEP